MSVYGLLSLLIFIVLAVNTSNGDPGKDCSEKEEYLYDSSNCDIFYECDESLKPQRMMCGPGTGWNQDKLVCDFLTNIDCTRGGKVAPK
uniref:U-scoloptoxin(01)-Tl1a n=1 Tax=Thereuopoda longicornis TaxID=353555 RepID=TX11A_THELO|nr:RecName: Full=U-scoloptoxin(01)-Tl1a; Short=U-SLPTX(01)-Tl1a; Flags: Precursor [Thereuopoda longicornis]